MTSPLRPILTIQTLKDAYEALRRSEVSEGNPLFGFMLVRQKLHHPASLRGSGVERRAVLDVLIEIAFDQLAHLRAIYDRPPPDLDAPLSVVIPELAQDGLLSNDQLIGCSFIYHRYVRGELNLSAQDIYDNMHYDDRQGRRRVNEYWEILLGEFIHRETNARAKDRLNRCLLAIPRAQYANLLSQQIIIEGLRQHINLQALPTQMLIYGVAGSGKSTIAYYLSKSLISDELIDDVAWIDLRPLIGRLENPSTERLASIICQNLQLPRHPLMTALQDLQSYLRVLEAENQRLLIVLLHVDEWELAIQEAWIWLSHCMVIATSERPLGSWKGLEVDCPPLDEDDTINLFDYFLKHHPSAKQPPEDSLYDYLWDFTGGNPRSLRNYFRAWIADTSDDVRIPSNQNNIKDIWQGLPNTTRQLWLLIDLLTIAQNRLDHQHLINEAQLTLSISRETIEADLIHLVQFGLIEQHMVDPRGKIYRIAEDIRDSIVKNALTKSLFTDHIDRLLSATHADQELSFGFLQQVFMLPFEISNLSHWLPSAHEYIRMSGQWDNWQYFLETLLQTGKLSSQDTMWFELETIATLRWLGQFDEALRQLELLLKKTNSSTDARLLGAVDIEKANLLFYKNYIHQSLEAAYEAYQFLSTTENPKADLMQRNYAAIIRALIDFQPNEAQLWLDRVAGQSPAVLNLVVELELKRGNVGNALQAAKQVLSDLSEDDPNYSRAHNILAKALIAAEQFNKAIDQFALAINLLQPKKDLVALARLYNNRSVALMYEGGLDESEENIQSSLMLHRDLEDQHGWNIARENLQLIHDLRARGFRSLRDSDFPLYSSRLL